ncbi:MAG: hypothetical protein NVSMB51_11800 [Solirubrobacteraceae bacterium]
MGRFVVTTGKPNRWGILSGVVFIVLVVVPVFVLSASTPDLKASSQEVATFYTQHTSREQAAGHLLTIAVLFGAIFVAHLWATLRWAGSTGAWTGLVLVGGAICLGGFLVGAALHLALADAADKGFAADGLRVLNALDNDSYPAFGGGLAILVLATGASLLGCALVPRWLAWVAVVLGVVAFSPVGFFAFMLSGLWLIGVSVLLSLKLSSDSRAAPTRD